MFELKLLMVCTIVLMTHFALIVPAIEKLSVNLFTHVLLRMSSIIFLSLLARYSFGV